MKKFIIILFWFFTSGSLMHAQTLFSFDDQNASPGENVCVHVAVSNFTDIVAMQMSFHWDPAVLQFNSVGSYNLAFLGSFSFGQNFTNQGDLLLSWYDGGGNSQTLPDGTSIFEMCFTVIGQPGDNTQIIIDGDPTPLEIVSGAGGGTVIGLDQDGGTVNIVEPQSEAIGLHIGNANAIIGEETCVNVSVSAFNDITNSQFDITWNPALLTFSGVGNFNAPGLDIADLDLTDASAGVLHVNWSDPAGITLADGTSLFLLCFTAAIGQEFSANIAVDPNSFISNTGSGNTDIGINAENGLINFGPPPVPDLVVNIGGFDIAQGLSFCIPVSVQEFNNVSGGFLSLQWDPAVITFDTMHVINLLNLDPQNFQVNASAGNAVLIWDSGIPFGLTLPDNSDLFELCFTATGAPGTNSTVEVSNFPLMTTFEDYQNNMINVSSNNGIVNILSNIPPLNLDISETGGAPGDTVCLQVTAGSYADLTHLVAGITWDSGLLQFIQVQNFGLTGLDNADFDFSGTAAGMLSLDWTSSQAQGLDLNNGASIFTICFKILADFDVQTLVQFDDAFVPGIVQTGNSNNNNVGLNTSTGAVSVTDIMTIVNAMITNVNCFNSGNGVIDIAISGGTQPYFYQWSNSSQQEDATNLNSGNYSVTVTDSSFPTKIITGDYAIQGDFDAPIVFVLPADEITCNITSVLLDGSFSTSGSVISYHWATDDGNILAGQNTPQATVNRPGTYLFSAMNTYNGCANEYTILVGADTLRPVSNLIALDTINCANVVASLQGSISSGQADYSFEWLSDDGNFIAGTTSGMNPVVDIATTYYLVGINNENGCRDTASVTVLADFVPPVALATVNDVLECSTTSLQIDGAASSSGPGFEVTWSTFEGHFVCCENTLTPAVDAPGLYFLSITNTVNQCESMTSVMVMADGTTPIAIIQTPDTISCEQQSVILDASNSTTGSDFSFQWTTSNGEILNGQNSASPIVGAAGSYQLIISYQQGLCEDTATIQVVENMNAPAVNAGADLLLTCTNTVVSPVASGNGAALWLTADGLIVAGENTFSPEFEQAGTYILTVTGANGCESHDTLTVGVDIAVPIAMAGEDIVLPCMENNISLDGSGTTTGNDIIFHWIATNGAVLSGGNTLNPSVLAGNYEIVVTDTGNGCSDTDEVVVSTYILPDMASAGPDLVVCDNIISITGNLPSGVTGIWTSGQDLQISDPLSATTTVSGLTTGNNTLTWTLSTADCPDYSSDQVTLTLSVGPKAFDDVYSISGGDSILVFDVATNDQLFGANSWDVAAINSPETGSLVNDGAGLFTFVAARGFVGKVDFLYTICNTYCETAPCDTGFVRINILDAPFEVDNDIIPNGITPNGDGLNDVLIFSELANTPEAYPDAELVVFNRWGDIVYKSQPYKNDWDGNSTEGLPLPQGTYYYVLRLSLVKSAYLRGDITIIR